MIDWKWINIFVRDIVIALLIGWVNWKVEYQSWWAAFLMGAMFVLVSWHLDAYMKIQRRKTI